MRACLGLKSEAARLACFDRLVINEPEAADTGESQIAAESGAGITAGPAAAPAQAASTSLPRATESERLEPDAIISLESLAQQGAVAEDGDPVTIVEVRELAPGQATFLTEEGQLFVQTSGGISLLQFSPVPFRAVLGRGTFGGLFLRDLQRGIRVRVVPRN